MKRNIFERKILSIFISVHFSRMAKFFRRELIYALIVMIGPLNFGFCMGFTSPAIPEWKLKWKSVPETQTTWFNSITSLFAVIGPFITTFMLGHMGRKLCLFFISLFATICWGLLLITSENRFWVGIIVRALVGLCVGGYSAVCPMFLVELAPKDITGFFGNLNQIGIVIGIIIMYLQGNWQSWWTLCITGIVFSALQCFLIWLVPETAPEKEPIETDGNQQNEEKESVWQSKYLGKLGVGIAMMVIQQFAGVNALITNLDQNFKDAGAPLASGIASTISVAAQLLAVFACAFLVDWLGRRPLFCISALGCGICLFIFALNERYNWANWLPIVVIFLYMFFFGAALGPVPWFVIPELFPDSVRAVASSIISCSNWICAFIVIFIYPPMKNGIGNIWTLVIFGLIAVAGSVFGFFFITEPKEKEKSLDWDENEEHKAVPAASTDNKLINSN